MFLSGLSVTLVDTLINCLFPVQLSTPGSIHVHVIKPWNNLP